MVTKLNDVTKALSKLLLFDAPTGIKVEGIGDTEFDVRTELVVTPITDTLDKTTMKKFAFGVTSSTNEKVLAQLFDVKLLLNGQPIQPNGKVKITIKITEELQNYKDLQVVYMADDGTVTIIPCEINGDEVTFITDHFSYYGVIGTAVKSSAGVTTPPSTGETTTQDTEENKIQNNRDDTASATGDNTPVILYSILAFLSCTAFAVAVKKRKCQIIKNK